jgi:CheY-specific phosphatase CheX
MSFCEVSDCAAGPIEAPALGAAIAFHGVLAGEFRLAISQSAAAKLSADFLAAEVQEWNAEQMQSVVAEFANVACGAVLSTVAPDADIHFSVPQILTEPLDHSRFTYHFSTTGETAEIAAGLSLSPAK